MTGLLTTLLLAGGLMCNSHDISSLAQWGPYSKQYSGISHISDNAGGRRVDFTVVPGFYRRSYMVPNVLFESGCYPWKANTDLSEIAYRYELEWKDRVYVDVTYHTLDKGTVLVEMKCVNNTQSVQNLLLHSVCSAHADENLSEVKLEEETSVSYAIDYISYEPAFHDHAYSLVYDGWMRGEKRDPLSLSGSIVSTSGKAGDRLVCNSPSDGPVQMRFRAKDGLETKVRVNGTVYSIKGSGEYAFLNLGSVGKTIELVTLGEGVLEIDAFIEGEDAQVIPAPHKYRPALEEAEGNCLMHYEGIDDWYGIGWNYPLTDVKQYENGDLDVFMRTTVHRHPPVYFHGDKKGHFVSAFQRPIVLEPQSDTTLFNILCCGDKSSVEKTLNSFRSDERQFTASIAEDEPQESNAYSFGEQLMEATILTDVVYPVYTQREFIRHFTPGKNWNSLYTWDSGFISLALGCLDPQLAFENLRAYTTEPGCQSAFIHHGTPLPTQFLAFEELIGKGISDEQVAFLYPRFKQYYDFVAGHNPESVTMMDSGLIRTWDYWYSTGGWDDYPPQHELRSRTELYPSVAPMVSSSYYIRAAKILRMVAAKLGYSKDVRQYDADIKKMSEPILKYAWDSEEGYFGYVTHNSDGKPDGIFRYSDNSNYNKGLDGVMPIMAGICPEGIRSELLGHIFSPDEMWADCGISTVDRSASYYREDGYWNGGVWMPHQYVLWKTMLDYCLWDEADRIAFTALDVWNRECTETYECFEHFVISSGRGAGWHNFSGLSCPVVNWYKAYFEPGTATAGFDTLISDASFSEDKDAFKATLSFDKDAAGRQVSLMVCLAKGHSYTVKLNGKAVDAEQVADGLIRIKVKASNKTQTLDIQ